MPRKLNNFFAVSPVKVLSKKPQELTLYPY